MECSMVRICKLYSKIPGNHPIIIDPAVWDRPVGGIDHTHPTFWETKNRSADILNGVISYILVENIFLARVGCNSISHQEPHQVHHMDNLLNQLPSGKVALTPPRGVQ